MNQIEKEDCFLSFVIENDGRNFKQGSKMPDAKEFFTPKNLNKIINEFNIKIQELDKRITALEQHKY